MKKHHIKAAAIVAIYWAALFGFSGCASLRPDYQQKLAEETKELQRRWDALDTNMKNHAEAVRMYAYQDGYVSGLEDAKK